MTKKDFELLANILGSIEFVKASEMTQITDTLARIYPSFNKDKFAKAYLERANAKHWDDDVSPKERFVLPDNAPLSESAVLQIKRGMTAQLIEMGLTPSQISIMVVKAPQDEETRVGCWAVIDSRRMQQWTHASNNQLRIALSQALDASAAERAEAEARLELMEYLR